MDGLEWGHDNKSVNFVSKYSDAGYNMSEKE